MEMFHRKLLHKSIEIFVVIKPGCAYDHCEDHQPPPPPPSSFANTSLSPLLILVFCGLAVSLSFICYLMISRRCRWNPESMDEPHQVFFHLDLGPVVHHPVWLINSVGLDQSEIESIDVYKYKSGEGLIEGTDCSVCLSEFRDDESLRLLPKCSHAFHVPCIDTWLRSHTNCPLCRAPIINNSTDTVTDSNLIEEIEDSESIEHVERNQDVEIENNRETCCVRDETSSGIRVSSDLADHLRVRGEESESVAMRRSVSMNESSIADVRRLDHGRHLSSLFAPSTKPDSMPKGGHKRRGSGSSISISGRAMKRSSFGHSSRKASSFTKRIGHLGSYNQSY